MPMVGLVTTWSIGPVITMDAQIMPMALFSAEAVADRDSKYARQVPRALCQSRAPETCRQADQTGLRAFAGQRDISFGAGLSCVWG